MSRDTSAELVLVDLSSIAYPIYLTTQNDPDPDKASREIASRIRTLTSEHPHVAICCDVGKSFRHDLVTSYKANRGPKDEPLRHQIALACESLKLDGYPVWGVRGFEADDLIASATHRAVSLPELTVLIISSDKDLLQLVSPRVRAKSARDGNVFDEAAVVEKFGVKPAQMLDYLTLVGDASDNVKGARGIGEKKAAELLATFETLDACYAAIAKGEAAIPPAMLKALEEFKPSMEKTRTLIRLRTDVEIPFNEIVEDRVRKEAAFAPMTDDDGNEAESETELFREVMHQASAPRADAPSAGQPSIPNGADSGRASNDTVTPAGGGARLPPTDAVASVPNAGESGLATSTALVPVRDGEIVPADYERQLDPRSMRDARILAKDMYESRMFSGYGSPQAVLSTVMVGRELGLPAMASLRAVHNIDGKHGLSAQLMVALILRSGFADYFEPVDFDEEHATYTTHRKGARNPVTVTHTIEMAWKAWPKGKVADQKKIEEARAAFDASGWGRNPTDMLVARATSRLARMVYPDLLAGLYTPEELAEIRREQEAA